MRLHRGGPASSGAPLAPHETSLRRPGRAPTGRLGPSCPALAESKACSPDGSRRRPPLVPPRTSTGGVMRSARRHARKATLTDEVV